MNDCDCCLKREATITLKVCDFCHNEIVMVAKENKDVLE